MRGAMENAERSEEILQEEGKQYATRKNSGRDNVSIHTRNQEGLH